jgi:hypothetical protein
VSFGKEIQNLESINGFRALVDLDLDPFLGLDMRSETVLYTDHCCMDVYSWTASSLKGTINSFRCEKTISSADELHALYTSISSACVDIAAVRIVSLRHPEFLLTIHNSEKSLQLDGARLTINLRLYLEQCAPAKGCLDQIITEISDLQKELQALDPLKLINGHDLYWMLTFSIKQLTDMPKRVIDLLLVTSSLVAYGSSSGCVMKHPMFVAISEWAENCN